MYEERSDIQDPILYFWKNKKYSYWVTNPSIEAADRIRRYNFWFERKKSPIIQE